MLHRTKAGIPFLLAVGLSPGLAQSPPKPVWKFAVSGDSRNCGDIVMPALASSVLKTGASFYWHLGDFRAIYDLDEDMYPPAKLQLSPARVPLAEYQAKAWPDFIERQLHAFGNLEIFLGIGNHETISPKTREGYLGQFENYMNIPEIKSARERDKDPVVRTYYHWVMNNSVDFIFLDNSSGNTFDPAQVEWVKARVAADEKDKAITTVVVGMHEALPGSRGLFHSMCDAPTGIERGREVYNSLWNLEQTGKKVYLLASHSHFVMEDVYDTPYWGKKVLPGWIVGTAGAVRNRLPQGIPTGAFARTDVYGYLLATVMSDGAVSFEFKELSVADLQAANKGKSPEALVGWCYAENKNMTAPTPTACGN